MVSVAFSCSKRVFLAGDSFYIRDVKQSEKQDFSGRARHLSSSLKIDKSFVNDITSKGETLVKTIIDMGV